MNYTPKLQTTQLEAIFADFFNRCSRILKSGLSITRSTQAGLAEKLTRWIANPFYLGANPKAGSIFPIFYRFFLRTRYIQNLIGRLFISCNYETY